MFHSTTRLCVRVWHFLTVTLHLTSSTIVYHCMVHPSVSVLYFYSLNIAINVIAIYQLPGIKHLISKRVQLVTVRIAESNDITSELVGLVRRILQYNKQVKDCELATPCATAPIFPGHDGFFSLCIHFKAL